MVDPRIKELEDRLRERVVAFVHGEAGGEFFTLPLLQFRFAEWPSFIFGGVLRDLMVHRSTVLPRDIDIVVDGVSTEVLQSVFSEFLLKRTALGGMRLCMRGCLFDIWPLAETWAFRKGAVGVGGFEDLPKTSFLNIEAIAAQLNEADGKKVAIFSAGFFEAILNRTIDINLEDNPNPSACVVRALITAARLRFAIGPRLAKYLSYYGNRSEPEELVLLQLSHYRCFWYDEGVFNRWVIHIDEELNRSKSTPVYLPLPTARQLHIWDGEDSSEPIQGIANDNGKSFSVVQRQGRDQPEFGFWGRDAFVRS